MHANPPPAGANTAGANTAGPDAVATKTVLLVEDEAVISVMGKRTLESYGYTVVTASTGEAAVALITVNPRIDLVLMDINLGQGIDGTEAAAQILAYRDLPLIFLSSHTERTVVEKTEGITSYGYIVKNSGDTVLIASIKMAFRLFEAKLKEREHERAIHEGEARNRALLSAIPDIMFVFDRDGYIRDCAAPDQSELAVAPEAFLQKHVSESLPDNLARLTTRYLAEVFRAGKPQLYEYEIRIADSVRRYESRLVRYGANHALSIVRDVTEQRRIQTALERQADVQRVLVDIASTFLNVSPDQTPEAIERALETMAGTVGADRAYIMEYHFDRGIAVNTYEWCVAGVDPQIDYLQAISLKAIAEVVALNRKGTAYQLSDVRALPAGGLREALEPQLIKSLIAVPLMRNGRCLGCVGFDYVREPVTCTETEIGLLTVFAGILSAAEQRHQSELARRESENRYRDLVENSNSVILRMARDGTLKYINAFAEKTFGFSRDEVVGRKIVGTLVPERDRDNRDMNALIEDITVRPDAYRTNENENITSTGERLWISWTNRVVTGVNGNSEILSIGNDVTQRRAAETAVAALLAEKELLLKETHHRIKNNMGVIRSMLALQAGTPGNEAGREVLENAAGRVQAMELLYDQLYRSTDHRELNAGHFLSSLIDSVRDIFPATPVVRTQVSADDFVLGATLLSPVGIIINELITNSMKHAFTGMTEALITVSARKRDSTVTIVYADNGIGIPDSVSFPNRSTFGMEMVQALVEQIDGSITLESNRGSRDANRSPETNPGTRFVIGFRA